MPVSDYSNPRPFSLGVLRRLTLSVLPIVALLVSAVGLLVWRDRSAARQLHQQAGIHLVDLHREIISREIRSVISDLQYLSAQDALRQLVTGRTEMRDSLTREYIRFCAEKRIYDQVRFLNADGMEEIRVNYHEGSPTGVAAAELQAKADRYYFENAIRLRERETFISPFDLNIEHGQVEQPVKPVIRVATPILDGAGVVKGVLVLNYLGAELLTKLRETAAPFPGTAWLLNESGYFLRGPSVAEEWGFMLGNDATIARDYPAVWKHISGRAPAESAIHLLQDDGLFSARAVRAGEQLTPAGSASGGPPAELPPAVYAGPKLIIVSYVPRAVLYAGPDRLLRRLTSICGLAAVPLIGLAWYLSYVAAIRRLHERRLRESEDRLRHLATRLLTAQEDERRHISRQLHDDFGQLAAAVRLDLELAVNSKDETRLSHLLQRALEGAKSLIEKLHETAVRVRPSLLDNVGFKSAIQDLISQFSARHPIATHEDLQIDDLELPAVVAENIYRVLQEALANVARHAEAPEVSIRMRSSPDRLSLQVIDQGRGFAMGNGSSGRLGILGMRERAELLGGTFKIESTPGRGTAIEVEIPLARNEQHKETSP